MVTHLWVGTLNTSYLKRLYSYSRNVLRLNDLSFKYDRNDNEILLQSILSDLNTRIRVHMRYCYNNDKQIAKRRPRALHR